MPAGTASVAGSCSSSRSPSGCARSRGAERCPELARLGKGWGALSRDLITKGFDSGVPAMDRIACATLAFAIAVGSAHAAEAVDAGWSEIARDRDGDCRLKVTSEGRFFRI